MRMMLEKRGCLSSLSLCVLCYGEVFTLAKKKFGSISFFFCKRHHRHHYQDWKLSSDKWGEGEKQRLSINHETKLFRFIIIGSLLILIVFLFVWRFFFLNFELDPNRNWSKVFAYHCRNQFIKCTGFTHMRLIHYIYFLLIWQYWWWW